MTIDAGRSPSNYIIWYYMDTLINTNLVYIYSYYCTGDEKDVVEFLAWKRSLSWEGLTYTDKHKVWDDGLDTDVKKELLIARSCL